MEQSDLAKVLSVLHKKDVQWLLKRLPTDKKAKVLRLMDLHRHDRTDTRHSKSDTFWSMVHSASATDDWEEVMLDGLALPPSVGKALAESMGAQR